MGSVGPAVIGQNIFYRLRYCCSSGQLTADIMSRVTQLAGLLLLLIIQHETQYQAVTQVQPESSCITVPNLALPQRHVLAHATKAQFDSTSFLYSTTLLAEQECSLVWTHTGMQKELQRNHQLVFTKFWSTLSFCLLAAPVLSQ